MEIPGKMEGLLGKSWKKTIGTLKYIKFEGMNRNYLMSCADGLNSCKCLQEGIQPSSPSILFTLLFSQRMLQSPIKFHGFNPTSISKAQFGSILGVSQNRATQLPLVIIHFRLRFSQTQKPSIVFGDPPWLWKPPFCSHDPSFIPVAPETYSLLQGRRLACPWPMCGWQQGICQAFGIFGGCRMSFSPGWFAWFKPSCARWWLWWLFIQMLMV